MSDEQHRKIYQTDGDRYEALIAREDHQGNILKAIEEIINPDEEEQKLNERNSKRIEDIEEMLQAFEDAVDWMREQEKQAVG